MKKIPSYPKITTKTNITVTQTQNININSPKAAIAKKGFKNQIKKLQTSAAGFKNQSSANLLKDQGKKSVQAIRKHSKKEIKQTKEIVNERSIKNEKSQRELAILSQKLRKLQQKINKIREKQKLQKNSSNSHRSFSKNRQNSNFIKKEATSSRKQLTIAKRYLIPKVQSQKVLKKSYSDKLGFEAPQNKSKYKKKNEVQKSRKQQSQQIQKKRKKQHHDEEILHQIVTQVPNSHPPGFKQAIQKSLSHYVITPSSQSEQEDDEPELYYIGKAIKSLMRPALFPIRQHLLQSLQTLQFLSKVRKPNQKQIQKKAIVLPHTKHRHTVVLDLDQTLIHCNQSLDLTYDVKLNIKFPTGQKIDAGVNIRPHTKHFLHELAKMCEIIVFTASHECYATVVLDHLDPKKQYISHKLFREHCWQTDEGIYIKDLRILKNRSLQNIILVDNAAYSYYFQLQNGVPIIPYYDDKNDKQLLILLEYIKQTIANAEKTNSTLRQFNKKYFRLLQYSKFEEIAPLVEELYSTDSSSHNN